MSEKSFTELTDDFMEIRLRESDERTDSHLCTLKKQLNELIEWRLERRYRTHAYSFVGGFLQNVQPVDYNSIDARLRQSLSDEEIRYLTKADLLLHGYLRQRPEQEVYLTLEVSSVIDANDVERVLRRASLLQKAGLNPIPAVGGQRITPDARTLAQARQVLIALDGNLQGADLEAED